MTRYFGRLGPCPRCGRYIGCRSIVIEYNGKLWHGRCAVEAGHIDFEDYLQLFMKELDRQ